MNLHNELNDTIRVSTDESNIKVALNKWSSSRKL